MTKIFKVTVEFSGTKTYEINAESEEHVENMFANYASFDHYTNAIEDRVSEEIVSIVVEKEVA